MIWLDGQAIKMGDTEVWGREMYINFSKEAKNVRILVFHVNDFQRVDSAEDDSNNQVETVWPILWLSVSLFPSHPCHH